MKKIAKVLVVILVLSILTMILSVSASAAIGSYYWYADGLYRLKFFISLDQQEVSLEEFISYEPLLDVVLPTAIVTDYYNIDLTEFELDIPSRCFAYSDIRSVYIPECYKVGYGAFLGCSELETVEMYGDFLAKSTDPYAMDTAREAFKDCTKLKSVILGDNVTRLPAAAFYGCSSLEYINLNNIEEMELQAFQGCASLTTVEGGEKLVEIGMRGFQGCTSLKSVNFPAVEAVCGYGFYNCASLESVELPALTTIYDHGFYECTSLESVDFPVLDTLRSSGFYNCTALEHVDFPALTTLYEGAFSGCTSLESVNLPSLLKIGNYGFAGCTSLNSIVFSNNITIGNYAFSECASLTSFDFSPVQEVGEYAFKGCTSLGTCRNYKWNFVPNGLFYDCTSLYSFDFSSIIKVGSNAFRNCKSLDIPYLMNATSIGSYAFSGCDKILTVRLNDATYGYGAYSNCINLQDIYVTDRVNALRTNDSDVSFMGLFKGCENVEYLYIGSNFNGKTYNVSTETYRDRYGDLSLHDFKNLTRVEIQPDNPCFFVSDGVVYYEDDTMLMLMCYLNNKEDVEYITPDTDKIFEISPFAFSDTKYLKKVIFTKAPAMSVESIYYTKQSYCSGDYAFLNSSVEEIVTSNGAFEQIPVGMFKDSQIKTIDLSQVAFVEDYAFENCKNLIQIEMPVCTEIFDKAFMGCENLESIRTPSLNYLGKMAFSNCSELKRVNLSGVNGVYANTFENCVNLEIVEFTEKANYIEKDAFSNCPKLSFYCDKDIYAYEYAIENNIPVVVLAVAFQNNAKFEYTGKEIQPSIIVALNDMALVENQDYVLVYSNNIEIGLGMVKVHFIGNFEGFEDIERTFLIEPREVSTLKIEYVVNSEYSGEEVKPKVVVKYGDKTLVEGVDYTIIYNSGSETGSMFFTIKGIGNYTGSMDCYYNIIRRDIAEATVSKNNDMTYTGEELMPKPVITWNGFTLVEGVDYEIRYFENVNSGYGTMVIYGMGNFCGTQRIQFRIFGKSIEDAVVTEIPDQTYTGSEITPEITVTLDGVTLTKDVDYTVKYENNIEKGVATVVINGIGNYSGIVKQTFNINKTSVYSFTVFSETEMTETYDGTELKPEMEVYCGTELLTEGVDYTVSLENNVNAGTATVTIIGIGLYEDERSYDFTILPCEIIENDISVSGNMEYNGVAVEPEITISKNGATLVEGKDYTVTYSNNNAVGTAIVTIEGKGNYKDSVVLEYEIYSTLNGWVLENDKWAYYDNGTKLVNKWVEDSVSWCYVGSDGYCVTNKWVRDSVSWCYLGADGRIVTDKWVADSHGWCYLGSDGRMVTNKWVKDSVVGVM